MSMKTLLDRVKDIRFIKIRGKEYDLYKEISISDDLQKVFTEHSERALFWGRLLVRERASLRKQEDERKEVEAEMFHAYWEAHEEKHKQFSDGLIWSYVHKDEQVMDKKREVRLSKKRVESLKTICDVFEHRRSMLMQLGAMHRREEEGLSIRKRRNRDG